MLVPHTPQDVAVLADKIEAIATNLRNLRADMVDSGTEAIELNTIKAEGFLAYLAEWSANCRSRHRTLLAKKHSQKKRREAEQRRNAARKS